MIILSQGNILDVVLNFSALIVVMEFDNVVGEFVLSYLDTFPD